ncbi:hypothetical protein OROMI_006224 [Orobanche minor]
MSYKFNPGRADGSSTGSLLLVLSMNIYGLTTTGWANGSSKGSLLLPCGSNGGAHGAVIYPEYLGEYLWVEGTNTDVMVVGRMAASGVATSFRTNAGSTTLILSNSVHPSTDGLQDQSVGQGDNTDAGVVHILQ